MHAAALPAKIFVFGNEDLHNDSLPLRILPELRAKFPDISFEVLDPNEEWNTPEDLTVIDTAIGIPEVMVFDDLEVFAAVPRLSMHDFDALTNLRFLKKLGKIKSVKIIAVPPEVKEADAVNAIVGKLKEM